MKKYLRFPYLIAAILLGWLVWRGGQIDWSLVTVSQLIVGGLAVFYLAMAIQALVFLGWTLHAWNEPKETELADFVPAQLSFTALLPVRHEAAVIGQTITAIAAIDYPDQLKELIVIVRSDDTETIAAAQQMADQLSRVHVLVVDDLPVNKPNQLNWGLRAAKGDVVVVFDAEDQPHRDIYHMVQATMVRDSADVVQGGVQLVNYRSRWFSALNCLEYYFWFKSILPWFVKRGVVPLGGNTVFFKRERLLEVGGWDETCLTEDGDIGIRMSLHGAKTSVVYHEAYATQEETPIDVASFIKQRTRWNTGFLQILRKGDWWRFPIWKQRFLGGYLLILPLVLAGLLFLTPFMTMVGILYHLPMTVAMLSFLPLAILGLQFVVTQIAVWQFSRDFRLGYPIWMPVQITVAYLPYICILAFAGIRAWVRFLSRNLAWEKTTHYNLHRQVPLTI